MRREKYEQKVKDIQMQGIFFKNQQHVRFGHLIRKWSMLLRYCRKIHLLSKVTPTFLNKTNNLKPCASGIKQCYLTFF